MTGGQVAFLVARHRGHAWVDTRIRHTKDSGIGRFPSREYAINQAWTIATSLAADLVAWLRLLAHRLGLRVKSANVLLVVDVLPDVRSIRTCSAGDNAPMRAVNRRLGYVEDAPHRMWQQQV